jgi:hypothetical protein
MFHDMFYLIVLHTYVVFDLYSVIKYLLPCRTLTIIEPQVKLELNKTFYVTI